MPGPCGLIEVELGELKKVGKEFAASLGDRLKTEVTWKGKLLIVPDNDAESKINVKDVKLQVKHVLHQLGFSEEYRVLAEHHAVRIVRVGEKYRPVEKKGGAPAPSKSLPYFFPG
jgi:hypothetical protein